MTSVRPHWPHTVDDIVKSLDGVWGLVAATCTKGNLLRLERSLNEPYVYTLTAYKGPDESSESQKTTYSAEQKQKAITDFARLVGFSDN